MCILFSAPRPKGGKQYIGTHTLKEIITIVFPWQRNGVLHEVVSSLLRGGTVIWCFFTCERKFSDVVEHYTTWAHYVVKLCWCQISETLVCVRTGNKYADATRVNFAIVLSAASNLRKGHMYMGSILSDTITANRNTINSKDTTEFVKLKLW